MVSPILIGAVILTLAVGGFYGSKEIFRLEGTNKTDVAVIPEEGNERFPKNFTEDLGEISRAFPVKEIAQSTTTSLSGIAKFFSTIITKIVGWVYNFFRPNATLPSYTGLLLFFFILILVIWKVFGNIYELSYDFLKYLLLIAGAGISIFFVLLILGVI